MSNLLNAIKTRLDEATSQEDGPVGLVFGAISREGEILVRAASGEAERGSGKEMQQDSVFCLYSCTKMIAGLACMHAVEHGTLKLDSHDLVDGYLPEVANATFSDGRKPKQKITLRHLLTHTAGFGYSFFHPEVKQWEASAGLDEFCGTIEGIKSPLIAEPGEDWHYSVGIDWAGELLHRVSGKTLSEYCQQYIFDPLGCNDIGFGVLPKHKGRLVAMHQRGLDGQMNVRNHLKMTTEGASFNSGGAGCVGTLEDYLKVMVVLLNKGVGANRRRIVSEATVQEMLRDQLPDILPEGQDSPLDNPIQDITPELTYPVQMMPGVKKGWGLTFQILHDDLPTGRKAGSVWWAGLPNNYWSIDPVSGIAHIILSQSFPFNDGKVLVPWLDCEKAVYDAMAR